MKMSVMLCLVLSFSFAICLFLLLLYTLREAIIDNSYGMDYKGNILRIFGANPALWFIPIRNWSSHGYEVIELPANNVMLNERI